MSAPLPIPLKSVGPQLLGRPGTAFPSPPAQTQGIFGDANSLLSPLSSSPYGSSFASPASFEAGPINMDSQGHNDSFFANQHTNFGMNDDTVTTFCNDYIRRLAPPNTAVPFIDQQSSQISTHSPRRPPPRMTNGVSLSVPRSFPETPNTSNSPIAATPALSPRSEASAGRNLSNGPHAMSFNTHHTPTAQYTPQYSSGSSLDCNSSPAVASHSPMVMVTSWEGEKHTLPTDGQQGPSEDTVMHEVFPSESVVMPLFSNGDPSTGIHHTVAHDSSESRGWTGFTPERCKLFSTPMVPFFRDMQRQIQEKNAAVAQWRWQTSSQAGDGLEQQQVNLSPMNLAPPAMRSRKRARSTGAIEGRKMTGSTSYQAAMEYQHQRDSDEGSSITLVSDIESIRESQIQDRQIYYDVNNPACSGNDFKFIHDAPSYACVIDFPEESEHEKLASNDLIKDYNSAADSISLASRSATWGTRRCSVSDVDSLTPSGLRQRFSFRNKEKKQSVLGNLTSMVRKESDATANKLKRNRSTKDGPKDILEPRYLSHGEGQFIPRPPQVPNGSRPRPTTPRLHTNLACSPGPNSPAQGQDSYGVSGSTSPFGKFGNATRRARSKSDIGAEESPPSLYQMLRAHGGPPLVKSPCAAPDEVSALADPVIFYPSDMDCDDEEDEESIDADGLGMEPELATRITPTYDGFREYCLKLNPKIETFLLERIVQQQLMRLKQLRTSCQKHKALLQTPGSCPSLHHCAGGSLTSVIRPGNSHSSKAAQRAAGDHSDDDQISESKLFPESFPPGIPMPVASSLPAEFECHLCFKTKVFNKPSDWTKHVHEDVQPFTCTFKDCRDPKSFKRKADWVRHENERHRGLEWWKCNVDDCQHKCFRKDNFLQHLVREHKYMEPLQKTKAAIMKAKGGEGRVWAKVDECHDVTATRPQDEPCKFCGKVMTSWKKLTVHLAKHMEVVALLVLQLVEPHEILADTVISPVEALASYDGGAVAPLELNMPTNMNKYSASYDSGLARSQFAVSPCLSALQSQFTSYAPSPASYGSQQFSDAMDFPLYGGTNTLDLFDSPGGSQPMHFDDNGILFDDYNTQSPSFIAQHQTRLPNAGYQFCTNNGTNQTSPSPTLGFNLNFDTQQTHHRRTKSHGSFTSSSARPSALAPAPTSTPTVLDHHEFYTNTGVAQTYPSTTLGFNLNFDAQQPYHRRANSHGSFTSSSSANHRAPAPSPTSTPTVLDLQFGLGFAGADGGGGGSLYGPSSSLNRAVPERDPSSLNAYGTQARLFPGFPS